MPSAPEVLVVDDNVDVADSHARLLEAFGYRISTAYSGRAALALASYIQPWVVLSDLEMPDLSGYELARCLRREPWGANTYLIAMSGRADFRSRELAREAGFDCCLTKPAHPEQLLGLIATAYELARRAAMGTGPTNQIDTD